MMNSKETLLWAMCGECGDVVYGGPGINPIPRECECRVMAVLPTETHGIVIRGTLWHDGAAEPELEYTTDKLDPMVTRRPVEERTVSQAVAHHMERVQEGRDV